MQFRFFVPDLAIAQPRQRFRAVVVRGKPTPVPYKDDGHPVHTFKDAVALACRLARPKGWPVGKEWAYRILVVIVRPARKKKDAKFPAATPSNTKPDGDNFLKGIKDALKGIAWDDDGRVYSGQVVKLRAGREVGPGTRVWIEAEEVGRPVDPAWVAVKAGFGSTS